MTQADIDRIKDYCEKATAGPWYGSTVDNIAGGMVYGGDKTTVCTCFWDDEDADTEPIRRVRTVEQCDANNAFITQARTDLPAAIAEIERLNRKLAHVSDLIAEFSDTPSQALTIVSEVVETPTFSKPV